RRGRFVRSYKNTVPEIGFQPRPAYFLELNVRVAPGVQKQLMSLIMEGAQCIFHMRVRFDRRKIVKSDPEVVHLSLLFFAHGPSRQGGKIGVRFNEGVGKMPRSKSILNDSGSVNVELG